MIYILLFLVLVLIALVSAQLGELTVEMRLIRTTLENLRDFMRRGQ